MKTILMCVQPCIKYYAWQIEVMLTNFESLKIYEQFDIHCLFAYNKNESDWEEKIAIIQKVQNKFSEVAEFYYYEDTRVYPISYISSIRPNVLKQHFKQYADLEKRSIFYHDCDIIFTKFPDFIDKYTQDDMNWYVSDTISYIGHDYILSKGEDVLDKMCDIVGINKSFVKNNQNNSGGCQYIMKGVDWEFFDKMEKDCERLYKEITELSNQKKIEQRHTIDPNNPIPFTPYHELQIWCADMWCILWGAWMQGFKTNIIPEMSFAWATDSIEKCNEKYIFHNAGVTSEIKETHFYKGDYRTETPYNIDFTKYDKTKASYLYIQNIIEASKNTAL